MGHGFAKARGDYKVVQEEPSKTSFQNVVKYKTKQDVPPGAWGKVKQDTSYSPLPNETPRQFVSRIAGSFYTDPFVDLMASWSEARVPRLAKLYPKTGSFTAEHMAMCTRVIFGNDGDSKWNYPYMKDAFSAWEKVKPLWDKPQARVEHTAKAKQYAFPASSAACKDNGDEDEVLAQAISVSKAKRSSDDDDIDIAQAIVYSNPNMRRGNLVPADPNRWLSLESSQAASPSRPVVEAAAQPRPTAVKATQVKTRSARQRELEQRLDELSEELVTQLQADDKSAVISSLKQKLHLTQEAIKKLETDHTAGRNEVYLSHAPEAAAAKNEGPRETQHAFPFVILGDGKAIIKPTNIIDLSAICDKAPNPAQNPITFCSYLQKVCRYHQLTGADYRFILEQCLKDTPEEEILEAVKGLDPKFDAPSELGYAWQDPIHVRGMFEELKTYLTKRHTQTRDITFAAACKQLPDETASGFFMRFHSAWVEHAGLPTEDKMAVLYISTFLSNMLPQHAQAVRILFSDVTQMTVLEFGKLLREKDAAGIFQLEKAKGPISTMFSQQVNGQRTEGAPRGGKPGNCHYCKKPGHWSRECRKRLSKFGQKQGQQGHSHQAQGQCCQQGCCNSQGSKDAPAPQQERDHQFPMKWNSQSQQNH